MCAWTSPKTFVVGAVLPAADLNTHLRDNLNETSVAKSTAAGDMTYATGANALARIAVGSTGKILMVNAANTPSWQNGLPSAGFFAGATALNYHIESGGSTASTGGNTVTFADQYAVAPHVAIGGRSQNYYAVTVVSTGSFTWSSDNGTGSIYWISWGSDT